MIIPNYTMDDLKKLPLRAMVALACRCARRVENLAIPPVDHPEHAELSLAVKDALEMAEDFARGAVRGDGEAVVSAIERKRDALSGDVLRDTALAAVIRAAHAALTAMDSVAMRTEPEEPHLFRAPTRPLAHLANVTSELAASEALTAARDAGTAAGYADNVVEAAVADFNRLVKLDLGHYPEAGSPIDPGAGGPLGPL